MPRTISSTGTPQVCGISPPCALIMSCSACGTEEEPCMTRWVCGSLAWIASMTWMARMSPSGWRRELVGAVAGAAGDGEGVDAGARRRSRRPGRGRSGAGRGRACPRRRSRPRPPPRRSRASRGTPSSPSTEAPTAWAISATRRGDGDVVVVGGGRLHVGLERAVHHHAGEAVADGREAGRLVVAVVLVEADRDAAGTSRPAPRPCARSMTSPA